MEAKIVIIPVESESSRQQRILKSISKIFDERAKSEVERRKVWVLEEEERRRRMGEERHPDAFKESAREAINEELLHKYNMVKTHVDEERERFRRMLPEVEDNALQRIVHEILTAETRVAEEKERAERVAEQENMKTGAVTMDQKKSEQHEAIQQQFMSFVHRKQLANAEEKERDRRIAQQDLEERVLSFNRVRESEASWIASIIGEEQERARRVAEDTAIEISEEVKREVERRQTWRAEEKERTRRILDDFADELANDLEREASLSEVLFVEERERQSRVSEQREHDSREPTKDELVQEDKKIQVEEEFMSVVHRKQAKEAEDMERTRRLLQDELDDRLKSEVDRRLTWIMEERERARRLMSDYALEYHLQLEREASRFEVQRLEEQERERRIRAEKTKAKDFTTQFTDAKERVQEEFMSVLDKVKTASLEEQERQRRVDEDSATIAKEQAETEVSSQLSRIWSRGVEEEERQRRISEELHRQLQESMDSELNRRKTWILEEEERQRRIAADKTNPVIQDLLKSRLGQVQQATKKV